MFLCLFTYTFLFVSLLMFISFIFLSCFTRVQYIKIKSHHLCLVPLMDSKYYSELIGLCSTKTTKNSLSWFLLFLLTTFALVLSFVFIFIYSLYRWCLERFCTFWPFFDDGCDIELSFCCLFCHSSFHVLWVLLTISLSNRRHLHDLSRRQCILCFTINSIRFLCLFSWFQ